MCKEPCIIIGGGVSFKKIDTERIKSQFIIGVNAAYKLGLWVDCIFTGDCRFIDWNRDELFRWSNQIYTCCERYKHWKNVIYLEPIDSLEINISNPAKINWAKSSLSANSGAASICLAMMLGYDRIFLLGFDGGVTKGLTHWHNYHKLPTQPYVFEYYNKFFKAISNFAFKNNIEIYNVNLESKIPCFKKIGVNEFYQLLSQKPRPG